MLNHLPYFPDWMQQAIFPLNRWLHVVCTTLLVGGTLFYEFVIPKAIEDLKEETQLAVLGRVRWSFRQIVILSSILLVLTGMLSFFRHAQLYRGVFREVKPWIWLHVGLGILSLFVALIAMRRTRAPRIPLIWLRVNFVILLIVIFVACVARHVRLTIRDNIDQYHLPINDTNSPPEVK